MITVRISRRYGSRLAGAVAAGDHESPAELLRRSYGYPTVIPRIRWLALGLLCASRWRSPAMSDAPAPHLRLPEYVLRIGAVLLGLLICLTVPACKPASDISTGSEQRHKLAPKAAASVATEDALVQQATARYQQRIQQAAGVHAANAKRMQEASVLDMSGLTQRDELEPKREMVRQFLGSNQTLKALLTHEESAFQEELQGQ